MVRAFHPTANSSIQPSGYATHNSRQRLRCNESEKTNLEHSLSTENDEILSFPRQRDTEEPSERDELVVDIGIVAVDILSESNDGRRVLSEVFEQGEEFLRRFRFADSE